MTKNIKLTDDYEKYIFNGFLKGKKMHGKYHFFNSVLPSEAGLAEGEGFKIKDVANDPTNVAIYDQIEGSPTYGQIIRYEGSNATPPTNDIECYTCNYGQVISMPTAKADKFLDTRAKIPDPDFPNDPTKFILKKLFEEVV